MFNIKDVTQQGDVPDLVTNINDRRLSPSVLLKTDRLKIVLNVSNLSWTVRQHGLNRSII
jgi:hypothetical protein